MNKSGISLIVLIITIIVVIILAGQVILSLVQNNPIGKAKEADFKNNVDMFNQELTLYIYDKLQDTNGAYDANVLNADTTTIPSITSIIKCMNGKKYNGTLYTDIFEIQTGKLVIKGAIDDEDIIGWVEDIGLGEGSESEPDIVKVESTSALWQFNVDTQTITGYLGSDIDTLTTITIPNYIDGIAVHAIEASSWDSCLGDLYGLETLNEVIVSEGIKTIGESSFYNCTGVTSIKIPSSVTSIVGQWVFGRCYSLSDIEVDLNNLIYSDIDGVLYNKAETALITYPIGKIESSYVIPNSTTSIEIAAFYLCENLTNVTIPNSVTTMHDRAFQGCYNLVSVIIPDSITNIESSTFAWCESLTDLTISDSVINIGESAFDGCESLTTVIIPDSVISIGESAFSTCYGLTSITLGNNLTTIGEYAFLYCNNLTSITITNNVSSIANSAFRWCGSLASINVSSSNTTYSSDNGVLYNKDKTIIVKYPPGRLGSSYAMLSSVTTVGSYAFESCNNLTSITIPNSVTSLQEGAFLNSDYFTSIIIPNSVITISNRAFEGCYSLRNVTISDSVTTIGESAFDYSESILGISVDINNTTYSSDNGVLYNKNKTTIVRYPSGKSGTSFVIPDNVTTIGSHALLCCNKLTSVTIPNTVTRIEESAFNNSYNLTSIIIPNSVINIGDTVFKACRGLTSITIPNSVTTIGNNTFLECTHLTGIIINKPSNSISGSRWGAPLSTVITWVG